MVDLEAWWMVEVEIDSIRVSLMSQQRIVILKERKTHDLLRNILQELGAEIIQVNITALRDDVFYARIIVTINGREISIDSRPSDALALAVRAHVPVFIAEDVMNEAASIPEENIFKNARSNFSLLRIRCQSITVISP
jgi:bifunctional DNase/RNase